MDVMLMAYGDLAETLADMSTATAVRVKGQLHIAEWGTGDGKIHHRMGVRVEVINALD